MEELIVAKVFSVDYNFKLHKELVPIQFGYVSVTYADTKYYGNNEKNRIIK